MFELGASLAFDRSTLSTSPPRHISQGPHANIHFINKNKEPKEAIMPTLTESHKHIIQVFSCILYIFPIKNMSLICH